MTDNFEHISDDHPISGSLKGQIDSSLHATQENWVSCDRCGQVQSIPTIQSTSLQNTAADVLCMRCDNPISFGLGPWREKAAALVITGVLLFIVSNCFIFMGLEVGSFHHEANLLSGVWALVHYDHISLAILVFVTIFLFPLLELAALCYLVIPCYLGIRLPWQVTVFRWLTKAAPWSMLEIFLLGVLVTSVKLGDMATIVFGVSIVAFFVLVAVLGAAYWCIDKRDLWAWLQPNNCFSQKDGESLYDCEICHALVGEQIINTIGFCPRCDNELHTRKPNSLQKTAAYTIAAGLLYLPANLLPIMSMSTILGERTDTIFSGVVALVTHGLWGIALVVFTASLVVPVAKLIILSYLVLSVARKDIRAMKERVWLFKLTELVGRWSMVDVFVVTLLTSLVQFGFLGSIVPGEALLPFAAVVVLTMLAAHSFDSRLIWDAAGKREKTFRFGRQQSKNGGINN